MPGFRGRGLLARILYSLPANTGRPAADRHRPRPGGCPRGATPQRSGPWCSPWPEWTDPAVLQLTPEAAGLDPRRRAQPRAAPRPRHRRPRRHRRLGQQADRRHRPHRRPSAPRQPPDRRLGTARSTARRCRPPSPPWTTTPRTRSPRSITWAWTRPSRTPASILRWLERTRPARFTKRELFTGVSRARFPKVGDLDAPLGLLEQHGYIRRGPEPEREGPGRRPSPAYEVHPHLAAETAVSAK